MLRNNPGLNIKPVNIKIPLISRSIDIPRNVLKNVGTGLKVLGAVTAVVSAANDLRRYKDGKISLTHLGINLVMNGVGFLGPVGTGFSIVYGLTEKLWWGEDK